MATTQRCGWLKDRYGFSWQVVPSEMGEPLSPGLVSTIVERTQTE